MTTEPLPVARLGVASGEATDLGPRAAQALAAWCEERIAEAETHLAWLVVQHGAWAKAAAAEHRRDLKHLRPLLALCRQFTDGAKP